MSYPARSNFRSGNAFDAHWAYVEGAVSNVCATQGASLVRSLQRMFGQAETAVWDDAFQTTLVQRAASFEGAQPNVGWARVQAALDADLRARFVSSLSLVFAIYVLYYRAAGRRFDAIHLPADVVLPVFGASPNEDGNYNDGNIVCFDVRQDVPPELLSGQNLIQASNESTSGVRLGPGRPVPQSGIVLSGGSPVGATVGILVVLGIAFAIFVVYASRKFGAKR